MTRPSPRRGQRRRRRPFEDGAEDHAVTLESILEEVVVMQRLVEDLVHLARVDAGAEPLRVEPTDLDDLALREARRLRESGRVEVATAGVSAAHVSATAISSPGR